jgi:hypothetical protein
VSAGTTPVNINLLTLFVNTQHIWEKLESSIEMAINETAIDDVIITGDFNDYQLDYSRTKISFLLTKFSLLQMIAIC